MKHRNQPLYRYYGFLSLNDKILDANVKKILIRFHGIKSALNEKESKRNYGNLQVNLYRIKSFVLTIELMDLGTICFK